MIAGIGKSGKTLFRRLEYGKALESLLVPAIVVLVGVAAFGLGRLSALGEAKGTLVVHPADSLSR